MSPRGSPIIASTNSGFSRARAAFGEPSAPTVCVSGAGWEAIACAVSMFLRPTRTLRVHESESAAHGVAHIPAASVSDVPACVRPVLAAVAFRPPDAFASPAVAVGHIARAAPSSVGLPRANVALARSLSAPIGVGHIDTSRGRLAVQNPSAGTPLPSRAVGVAQSAASLTRSGLRRARSLGQSPRCDARGVGHICASFASIGRFVCAASLPVCVRVVTPASGVGQKGASVGSTIDGVNLPEEAEHPLAPVRRANVAGGTEHRRLQSVAHSDQRLSEPPDPAKSNEIWNILDEDQGRLALADDAREVPDEVSRVVASGASSCAGVGLTRDAASDEIHDSTPRASVEGGNVRPERRRSHGTRFHRCNQVRGGECFPLHVADRASRHSGEVEASLESAISGADAEGT